MENMESKNKAVMGRWLSVFGCGLVAAIIWLFIAPWFMAIMRPFSEHLATWPFFLGVVALFVLLAVVFYSFGRDRWAGFFGLKHFWKYPPLWVAIVVAAWIVLPQADNFDWTCFIFLNICAIGLMFFICWLSRFTYTQTHDFEKQADATGSPKNEKNSDLGVWLANDDEINHPDQDHLGHDVVAKRIARRIKTNKNQPPSIAIIGLLGSGKSSIGRLVEHHLKKTPSIQYLQIPLWPYNTVEAAVSGVLNSLLDKLGQELNTLALSGLPNRYLFAIERAVGPFSGFARLLEVGLTPSRLLNNFATIAAACNLKFVLWIDDFERFSDENIGVNNPAVLWQDKADSLRSLLYLLDQQACISVIVAGTTLDSRFDQQKIARYIERVPRLDHESGCRLVNQLRKKCLDKDFINSVSPEESDHLFQVTESVDDVRAKLASGATKDEASGITISLPAAWSALCDTPRALKSVLRLTYDLWGVLSGEIDFDHLLFISLIRVTNPNLFAFFDKHITLFKNGVIRDSLDEFFSPQDASPPDTIIIKEFNETIISGDTITALALKRITSFLFPKFLAASAEESRLQGVDKYGYWQRYTRGLEVPEEERDQLILRSIEKNTIEDVESWADFLLNRDRYEKTKDFLAFKQVDSALLCLLLEAVAKKESLRVPDLMSKAGIFAIKELMENADRGELSTTVARLIKQYTGVNLTLIRRLQQSRYLEIKGSGTEASDNTVILQENLISAFCAPDQWGKLLGAIQDAESDLISHIISDLAMAGGRSGSNQYPFKKWPQFSEALLKAAEHDPQQGIPQVLSLIINEKDGLRPISFNGEKADTLFGNKKLISLLEKVSCDTFSDQTAKEMFVVVKKGLQLENKTRG